MDEEDAPATDVEAASEAIIEDIPADIEEDTLAVADTQDEEDEADDSAVSVFAYLKPRPRATEDEDDFDRARVKAAVVQLAATPREPERPMTDWDDEE
jgi:segregation and condensation protein B